MFTLVAMMAVIGAEVALRNVLRFSWEGTDEIASYLVVAATFLSLATCQAWRGFHELQIVKARLSPRGVAVLNTTLHIICLICTIVLLWQFSRLVVTSFRSGETSTTTLAIPLWIPQSMMPLGVGALCVALVRSIRAEWRTIAATGNASSSGT